MIKSQPRNSNNDQVNLKQLQYNLAISEVQILNQNLTNQCYITLKSSLTGKQWQSNTFFNKLPTVWELKVDSPVIILQLHTKTQQKDVMLSKASLEQGSDTITLSQAAKQNTKICAVRYQLHQVQKNQKRLKGNYFANNSNIFDQFMNDNEISRVQPTKKLTTNAHSNNLNPHDQSDQRMMFNGQSFIQSQMSYYPTKDQIQAKPTKQEQPNSHRQSNKNDNLSQNRLNVPNIKVTKPNNQQDERHRFQHTFNDTINISLDDSKSDIKDIISIIQTKKEEEQKAKLDKINQNQNQNQQQFITTAQRWYKNKFNKKNLKLKNKNTYLYQTPEQDQQINPKAVQVKQHNPSMIENEEILRQISDMSVDHPLKLKSIDFSLSSDGQTKKLYSLSRFDAKKSSLWYTTVSLPSQATIFVQCQSQNGYVNGCLGKQQIKKGQCVLYDEQGKINGNLNFKSKLICNFLVQTHEILDKNQQGQSASKIQGAKQEKHLEQNKLKQGGQQQPKQQQKQIQAHKQRSPSPIQLMKFSQYNQSKQPVSKNQRNEDSKIKDQSPEVSKVERIKNFQNIQHHQSYQISSPQIQNDKSANPYSQKQTRKSSPIQSLNNWRKYSSSRIQQQKNSQVQQNEGKAQNKKTIQNLSSQITYEQIRKTVEKEYQQNRLNIKKQKLSKFSTINYEINAPPSPKIKQSMYQNDDNEKKEGRNEKTTLSSANRNLNGLNPKQKQDDSDQKQDSPQPSIFRRHRMYSYNNNPGSFQNSNVEDQPFFNSNSYRLSKFRPHQSQSRSTRQRPKALRRLYSKPVQNQQDSQIQQKQQEYTRKNLSQAGIKTSSKNNKPVNFKITNIKLTLHKALYNTKFIKMKIGKKQFFTETTRDFCYMSWKGKGYFFYQISQFSILYIDLVQSSPDGENLIGRCKIQLPLLRLKQRNKVQQYHDYIRKQNQQSLGRLQINYQVVQKRGKSLQGKHNSLIQLQQIRKPRRNYSTIQNEKKQLKKPQKKQSIQSSNGYDLRKIPLNLGKGSYSIEQNIFSRLKGRPPLTKRKYIGGNTLIPKASRFRDQNELKKFTDGPGPGAYQVESSFDRHASPI